MVFFKSAALVLFQWWNRKPDPHLLRILCSVGVMKVQFTCTFVEAQSLCPEKKQTAAESSQDHDGCSAGKLWLRPERIQDWFSKK